MNKLSRYAHLIELDGNFYLFNVANGYVIALNHILYTLISRYKEDIDQLKSIHPDLYAGLDSCHVIVADDKDEPAAMIEKFEALDCDPSTFGITINPTLDCNLRCWYCYESHGHGTMMSAEVIESIKHLIDRKLADQRLKYLNISFFGGEPLLGWDKVVMPILTYATKECAKRSVTLKSSFTTNGVLLSNSRFDELVNLGLEDTFFQISIDGNKALHDNSRVNAAKHPTYDKIMANVALGAAKGFNISLRFNYTPENLDTYIDVLTDLKSLPDNIRKNISCSFHQVWQTVSHQNSDNIKEKVDKLSSLFQRSGFTTSNDRCFYRYVCYGDRTNHVVINYNGDLYKCTAREFTPSTREGSLTIEGELTWNNRYVHRMNIKYANVVCRQCSIMPICNGGCTQNKLERLSKEGCPLGKDNKSKYNYLYLALNHQLYQ